METLEEINKRIRQLKADLAPLLKEKERILTEQSAARGCTCLYQTVSYSVYRLRDPYCKATDHPEVK